MLAVPGEPRRPPTHEAAQDDATRRLLLQRFDPLRPLLGCLGVQPLILAQQLRLELGDLRMQLLGPAL